MARPVPGQELILRIMATPNASRAGGSEWRVGELVRHALQEYGVTYSYESAGTAMRQTLVRKGWVTSRKESKGSALHSLTDAVSTPPTCGACGYVFVCEQPCCVARRQAPARQE
jgi:hypothetical protein